MRDRFIFTSALTNAGQDDYPSDDSLDQSPRRHGGPFGQRPGRSLGGGLRTSGETSLTRLLNTSSGRGRAVTKDAIPTLNFGDEAAGTQASAGQVTAGLFKGWSGYATASDGARRAGLAALSGLPQQLGYRHWKSKPGSLRCAE